MKPQAAHFQRIDVLRGVAIFAVFVHHYWLGVAHNPALAEATRFATGNRAWFALHEFGYLGVKLFFVISGFCIHHSYLNWRARNRGAPLSAFLPGFLQRRFWRILPPYVLVLLPLFFWKYDQPFALTSLKHLAVHLSLTNTLVPGFFYNIDPAFWSIAVEWQLYLVYPLALLVMLRFGGGAVLALALGSSLFFELLLPRFTQSPTLLNLPFAWWYDWVIGAVLAGAFAEKRQLFRAHLSLSIVLFTVLALNLSVWNLRVLNIIVGPLLFAVVVEAATASRKPLGLLGRAVGVLGLCSFSFYLLHGQITYLFTDHVLGGSLSAQPASVWLTGCALLFVFILGLSWLSYRFVELGSVRLGERLSKRTPARPGAAAAAPANEIPLPAVKPGAS